MKRVTLRQIAAQAGVSIMTVSLALRDSRQISDATREKLKGLAKQLGYRPDPALSALMAYRHERQTVRDYSTLAFLTHFETEDGWRNEVFTRKYFEGAASYAEKLGYRVEPFWLGAKRLTRKRAVQILEVRGIKGLLVAPVPSERGEIDFDWDRFCAVSLCRNLASPYINVVDHNHYQSMGLAWKEARSRGYQRVGYAVSRYSEEIAGRLWSATLLMEQSRADSAAVPPCVAPEWRRGIFEQWLRRHRPDVVISPHIIAHRWLGELGLRVPDDVGFIWLEAEPDGGISGICQHFPHVGIVAVDLLHLELLRSAYGIPSVRQTIGIDGTWHEGRTLRASRGPGVGV